MIRDQFLQLAGGKKAKIVVIPTASTVAHKTNVFKSFVYWKNQDVGSVIMLHTLDRDKANQPEFIKPLTEATGVWLAGGDQSCLTSAYRGTAVEREMRKLLERGGVIGGTSAGASAMSSVMILGGNPLAEVGKGFGFLPDIVIDQHFQNRNRLNRLLGVVSKYPTCLGMGIDEQTAVIVKGHMGTVLGKGDVRMCLPPQEREPAKVQVLKSGQIVDLLTLSQALLRLKPSAEVKPSSRSGESTAPEPSSRPDGERARGRQK